MDDLLTAIGGWFVKKPERIVTAGSACSALGGVLFFAGLWGCLSNTAINAVKQFAKKPLDASLATSYPSLPTWWIPEATISLLLAALLLAFGMYVTYKGRELKKHARCRF